MNYLRAYWRWFWRLCPACNCDAPACDTCRICLGYRGGLSRAMADLWLAMYLESLN